MGKDRSGKIRNPPRLDKDASGNHHHPPGHKQDERAPHKPASVDPLANGGNQRAENDDKGLGGRQLNVAKWLNYITAAGTLAALVGLVFLYESIRNGNDAMEYANRALIAPRGMAIVSANPGQ